jgi:hypothetical protein
MVTVPFTFTPDTVADATQVNANFQSVANPAGPLGVGVTPPANASPGRIFATGGVTLNPVQLVTGGDMVGHWMVNLYVDTAGVFRYLNNGPAFELVCDDTTQTWALRQAAPGTAGAAVTTFQRTVSFQPGLISIDPLAVDLVTPGDSVGHVLINAVYSQTASAYVYVYAGPALDLVFDATTQLFAMRQAPVGAAGATIAWTRTFSVNMAPAASATNVALLWNNAGAVTLQTVQVGALNSGGTGFRQLIIPN